MEETDAQKKNIEGVEKERDDGCDALGSCQITLEFTIVTAKFV